MMIQGLQAAVILFHNHAVDLVEREDRRLSSEQVFEKARELTRWHYQWIVLNEVLPNFVGQPMVDNILRNGRRFYRPSVPQIPVEFQGAAYRFGHTMIRPSYRANLGVGDPHLARRRGILRDDLRPLGRRPGQSRSTCAVAPGRAGASSAGRPSSISARSSRTPRAIPIQRSGRTSGSMPSSRRRCSTSRSRRSRAPCPATSFHFPSATCSAASRGACRPDRESPGRWGRRCSTRAMIHSWRGPAVSDSRSQPGSR